MTNPIRRTSSRLIHQGRLVRLCEDSVVLPRGTETTYEHVEIKNGSSTLAMEDNGDVWLVREWKYAIDRPSLEVVSGGIEPGEDPLDAARRELREEAGLTAREWIPMGHVDPFTTMLCCPNHLFLARGLSPVERDPEEAEIHMELQRVPLEEAVSLVMAGEITHAIRFTLPCTANARVPPATHQAVPGGCSSRPPAPPMGLRVRLKASVDISKYSPPIQVILRALKKYGMFVADNGGGWFLSGAPDPRWSDDELGMLKTIHGRDFEVVKMGRIVTQ